jgi:very-short-patch-repair endonuclease
MPPKQATPKLQHRAAELRHDQTPAEAKLWRFLRAHRANDVHFRRQHAIGNYIVDFCSPNRKLIIEVDGSGHLEQQEYDNQRTAFLRSKGYKVLRFWNNEVSEDLDGVMRVILDALDTNDGDIAGI